MFEEYNDDDDDHEDYSDNDYPDFDRTRDEKELTTGLEHNMKEKIISLQDQLLKHAYGNQKLSDNDVIRYSAMVDILKSMLGIP